VLPSGALAGWRFYLLPSYLCLSWLYIPSPGRHTVTHIDPQQLAEVQLVTFAVTTRHHPSHFQARSLVGRRSRAPAIAVPHCGWFPTDLPVPEGLPDNSPPLQPWVGWDTIRQVPQGRLIFPVRRHQRLQPQHPNTPRRSSGSPSPRGTTLRGAQSHCWATDSWRAWEAIGPG
jgi:hypothetical protein